MSHQSLLKPQQNKQLLDKPDNPTKGIFFYLLAGSIICINLLSAKFLYERNPELNGALLLVYRSALSSVILCVYHNTNLRYVIYDSIDKSCVKPLIIRVIAGNLAIFALFMATKYFSLTATAMVLNCSPLVSICLAGPILKEKVTKQQIFYLLIAFLGVSFMILGGRDQETRLVYQPNLLIYIVFLLQPVALSAGTLAMRAARKLNEDVVASYMAFSLFLVFFPICLVTS